jgi:protein NrfD
MSDELKDLFRYDGRNLDPDRAELSGEAITLEIDPDRQLSVAEMAIVKPPRWEWPVPAYLFVGGLAGGAATLGLAVELLEGRAAGRFVRGSQLVSGIGTAAGAGLLVADLGRPERFTNMLRVFRPSSPMNVGAWVLVAQSGSTWLGIAADMFGGPRARPVGRVARVASGLLGMPLAGYTGVLLGATANPAWFTARRHLPPLFVSSAMSAAGGVMTLLPARGRDRRSAELFGILGRVADLTADAALRRHRAQYPATDAAATIGRAGRYERVARYATAGSLALALLGLRSPTARRLGAVAAVVGSLSQRFAVFEAGKAASTDPQCVIETQR